MINAIEAYDKTATKVNGYLSAWFRLALNDAIALSDPIAALVTGQLRFPLWDDTSDEALGDSWEQHDWHRPELLEKRIHALEEVLRSDHVEYMAREHAGYAAVTGTAYDSLDFGSQER